jgi:hypothetical protein
MVRPTERIPAAHAAAIANAGVDPTLEGRALQDALIAAITVRRGYVDWTVARAGRVVTLMYPGGASLLRSPSQ